MQDYAVSRLTRRCHRSDRPLEPGERFYSYLMPHDSHWTRIDVAESQWQGAPEGALGWWCGRMPMPQMQRRRPTPYPVLLETLAHWCKQPDQTALAYLLGIYLVRKRILVLVRDDDLPSSQTPRFLHLRHPTDETDFLVPDLGPMPQQWEGLQEALLEVLYRDEA